MVVTCLLFICFVFGCVVVCLFLFACVVCILIVLYACLIYYVWISCLYVMFVLFWCLGVLRFGLLVSIGDLCLLILLIKSDWLIMSCYGYCICCWFNCCVCFRLCWRLGLCLLWIYWFCNLIELLVWFVRYFLFVSCLFDLPDFNVMLLIVLLIYWLYCPV